MVFFGVTMGPMGWLMTIAISILLLSIPMTWVSYVTPFFPASWEVGVSIVVSFVLMPIVIALLFTFWWKKYALGRAVYLIYCGFYALLFLIATAGVIGGKRSLLDLAGPVVTGIVFCLMVGLYVKAKTKLKHDMAANHVANRDDDIQRQAEAIVLAEDIRKERERS